MHLINIASCPGNSNHEAPINILVFVRLSPQVWIAITGCLLESLSLRVTSWPCEGTFGDAYMHPVESISEHAIHGGDGKARAWSFYNLGRLFILLSPILFATYISVEFDVQCPRVEPVLEWWLNSWKSYRKIIGSMPILVPLGYFPSFRISHSPRITCLL